MEKQILILTAGFGEGHNSAARGIRDGLAAVSSGTATVALHDIFAETYGGVNDWTRRGYGGPCPPIGRHRYFFKLYALDQTLPAGEPLTKAGLEAAIKGHVVAQAELIGTYQKGDR